MPTSPLEITQEVHDQAEVAANDAVQILKAGAELEGTDTVLADPLEDTLGNNVIDTAPDAHTKGLRDTVKAISIGLVNKLGTPDAEPGTLVKRDEEGDFAGHEITADILKLTASGGINLGGSYGTSGYVLTSQGPGVSPIWAEVEGGGGGGGGTVTGTGSAGAVAFWNGTSAITEDPTQLYWDNANNRLAIGTNVAADTLHVAGTGRFTGNLRVNGDFRPNNLPGTSGQVLTSAGSGVAPTWTTPITGSGSSGALAFWSAISTLTEDPTQLYWDNTNNRLGIGTASPAASLDVRGSTLSSGISGETGPAVSLGTAEHRLVATGGGYLDIIVAGGNRGLRMAAVGVVNPSFEDMFFQLKPGHASGYGIIEAASSGGIMLSTSPAAPIVFAPNRTEIARFSASGGRLLLGSTSDDGANRLQVTGSANITASLAADSGTLFANSVTHRVGVGTLSPAEKLDVAGNVQFSGALMPSGSAGTSGQVLTSQGTGVTPIWTTPTTGTGSSGAIAFWSGTSTLSEDPTQLFWDNSNNRLGVGTASPSETLHIVGNILSTGTITGSNLSGTNTGDQTITLTGDVTGSGTGSFATTLATTIPNPHIFSDVITLSASSGNILIVDTDTLVVDATNNRVGIGTASPTKLLDITSSIASGLVNVRNSSTSGWASIDFQDSSGTYRMGFGYGNASVSSVPLRTVNYLDLSASTDFIITSAATNTLARFSYNGDVSFDGTTFNVNASNNRVGIGTSSPTAALDVTQSVAAGIVQIQAKNSSSTGLSQITSTNDAGRWMNLQCIGSAFSDSTRRNWGEFMVDGASAGLNIATNGSSSFLKLSTASVLNTPVERMRIDGSGNVRFDSTDNTLYIDATNNRVGIGTASPSTFLHIETSSSAAAVGGIARNTATNGAGSFMVFNNQGTWGTQYFGALMMQGSAVSDATRQSKVELMAGNTATGLDLRTNRATSSPIRLMTGTVTDTPLERMQVFNNGNVRFDSTDNVLFVDAVNNRVGIGTDSPSDALQVVGNICFSGDLRPNNLPGTSGQVLTSAGAGAVPTWTTPVTAVTGSAAWSPASLSAGQYDTTTVAMTGVAVGTPVIAGFSGATAGCIVKAEILATDVATVYLWNISSGSVSPTSGTVTVKSFGL